MVVGGAIIGLAKEGGHVVGTSAMRVRSRNGMKQRRERERERERGEKWQEGGRGRVQCVA